MNLGAAIIEMSTKTGKAKGKKTGKKSGSQSPRTPTSKKASSRSSSPVSPKSPKSPKSKKSSASSSPEPKVAVPLPAVSVSSKTCPVHLKPYRFFSETREELLCEDCQARVMAGGQRLIAIEDAHRLRLGSLYHLLNTHLYSKKEQLTFQRSHLQLRLAQVREVKQTIDMDMKNEFSAMNERLNSAYKAKEALLQHLCQEIRIDLDRIASIASNVESLGSDAVGFLQRAAGIRADCEMVLSKGYSEEIPVSAEDLPKELSEVRRVCEDYHPLLALLDFKDETMWKLRNRPAPRASLKQEVIEWARLADHFSQELNRLKLTCEFCGCQLDPETVNNNCQRGGRHHWIRAEKFPSSQPMQFSIPSTVKTPPEKEAPNDIFQLLNRLISDRKIDFSAALRQKDPSQTGFIRVADLFHLLVSTIGLSDQQAGQIVDRLDPGHVGNVPCETVVKEISGGQQGNKLLEVMENLKKKDKKQTGLIAEKKMKNALLKAEISAEDALKLLKTAEKTEDGEVKYRESILKWTKT